MASMNKEQLDALRNQIEEDYRLDLAAIERLQRRFVNSGSSIGSVPAAPSAPSAAGVPLNNQPSWITAPLSPLHEEPAPPSYEPVPNPQPDELHSSLRSMFSSQRNR